MKKSIAAISSLLLLGSLGYLATQMRYLNLSFDLQDGEELDIC